MRASFFLAAALSILAANADDSTTTIGYFGPSWDAAYVMYGGRASTAASVAGINAVATTYHVGCLKDAPKTDCDIKNPWTIIQGPETVSVTAIYTASTSGKKEDYDLTVTQSYQCSFKHYSESASCTMSVGITGTLGGGSFVSSTSSKASYATAASSYYDVVVTGGVKSFTAPAATKTPGAAPAGPAGALITAAPAVAAAAVAALL